MKTVTTKTRQGPLLRVFSLLLAALLLMGVFSPFALFAEGDFLLDGTGDARVQAGGRRACRSRRHR